MNFDKERIQIQDFFSFLFFDGGGGGGERREGLGEEGEQLISYVRYLLTNHEPFSLHTIEIAIILHEHDVTMTNKLVILDKTY